MSLAEPELICLDSDDEDENPPSNSGRNPTVSVLFREGAEIDLSQIITPKINFILANDPIGSKVGPSKELFNLPTNAGMPRVLMRMPRSNGSQSPRPKRTKHYGAVNIVETTPISNPRSFIRINATLSNPGPPLHIPEVDLTMPANRSVELIRKSNMAACRGFLFEAKASAAGRLQPPNEQHFVFRCTFANCKQRIRGNVNFVFHLWSHVAVAEETVETYNQNGVKLKTHTNPVPQLDFPKVECVSRCPECLAVFPTPVLMLIHYTKCHSQLKQARAKSTCRICEKDMVTMEKMTEHMAQHRPMDAPYGCKTCSFRSNVRSNVVAHFAETHKNTGLLMCPFCFFHVTVFVSPRRTVNPGYHDVNKAARKFAAHMFNHASKKKLACNLCSVALGNSRRDLESHKDQHRIDCSHGYEVKAVNPKELPAQSKVIAEPVKCKNCGKGSAWRIRRGVPCLDCKVKDFWKLVDDKLEIKEGLPGSTYACLQPGCKLPKTKSVPRIMTHFNITGHKFDVFEEIDGSSDEDDDDEHLKNIPGFGPRSELSARFDQAKRVAALRAYKRKLEPMQSTAVYLERRWNFENVLDGEQFTANLEQADQIERDKIKNGRSDRPTTISRFKMPYSRLPVLPPMSKKTTEKKAMPVETEPVESEEDEEMEDDNGVEEEEDEQIVVETGPVSIMKPMRGREVDEGEKMTMDGGEDGADDVEEEEDVEGESSPVDRERVAGDDEEMVTREGTADVEENGEEQEEDWQEDSREEGGDEEEEAMTGRERGEEDETGSREGSAEGVYEEEEEEELNLVGREGTAEAEEVEEQEDNDRQEEEIVDDDILGDAHCDVDPTSLFEDEEEILGIPDDVEKEASTNGSLENEEIEEDKTMEDTEISQGARSSGDDELDSAAEEEIRRMERAAKEDEEEEEYEEVDDYQVEEMDQETAPEKKITTLSDSPDPDNNDS